MGIEYELKYRAQEKTLDTLAASFPGSERTYRMETTYYDTSDGSLAALGYTLRRRLENGEPVCTLKTPGTPWGRGEWEVPAPSVTQALPELGRISGIDLAAILDGKNLIPICGAKFTRVAKMLALPECTAELALDRGVLTGGGRELPFAEIELELKSGAREAMDDFGRVLAQKYGLEKEPLSKFRRALALAGRENDAG